MDGKKLIELKQERATLTIGIRSILDEFETRDLPGEKKDELAKMEKRFDELNGLVLSEERQLERERVAGAAQNAVNERRERPEKRTVFMNYLRSGDSAEYRALQTTNAQQAGYLVMEQSFIEDVIKTVDDELLFRQYAKVYRLNDALSLGFPKRSNRMNKFAWGGEVTAPTPDQALKYGKKEFKPNYLSGAILISKPLLRVSSIAEAEVVSEIAYGVGSLEEEAYFTGDGNQKPLGVFAAGADGIPTSRDVSEGNTASAITYDGLVNAKYSVKQAYWRNGRWFFHRDIMKQIVKLKDGDNRYIWVPDAVSGQPDRLLNQPFHMSEFCPNTVSSGAYVGIFGDFGHYRIVDALDWEIQILNELYAPSNQVCFMVRAENDGMPVLEEAFARVKLG